MKVSTQLTLDFITKNTKVKNRTILEAGCGEGDLAYELHNKGAKVTAVDIDPEVIPSIREKGISVIHSDFINVFGEFDILLFTRSLHHMTDLNVAIQHAKNIVNNTGCIILEEFDYKNIDVRTAKWFYKTLAKLKDEGLLKTQIEIPVKPLKAWKDLHDHRPRLNTGAEMIKSVKSFFSRIKTEHVPYLFRYIEDLIVQNDCSVNIVREIYEDERDLISSKQLLPLGIRMVGVNK